MRGKITHLDLQVHLVFLLAACLSLKTFLKSLQLMRAGEAGWWTGQERGKLNCREESALESERAREDLK